MLNPKDKRALNEVVYLTGLKITVRLMTNQEFENLLDTYFNKSNKETLEIIKSMEEEATFDEDESFFRINRA